MILLALLLVMILSGCQSSATAATVNATPTIQTGPTEGETIQSTVPETTETAATEPEPPVSDTENLPVTEATEPSAEDTEPTTEPKETTAEPKPTEPAPTEAKPTENKPTEQKPTEPAATSPKPTEPAPTEPPHTHSWSTWTQTKAPTCGASGEEARTCSCGIKETRPVSATGKHTWSETAPTCTQAGAKTCSGCGKAESLSALGHDFQFTNTVAPTTSAGGYDLYTCSRCGATEQRNKTDKLPEVIDLQAVIEYGLAYAQSLGYTVDRTMTPQNSSYYPGYLSNMQYFPNEITMGFLKARAKEEVDCTTSNLIAGGADPRGVARCNIYASYDKDYSGEYYIIFLYG